MESAYPAYRLRVTGAAAFASPAAPAPWLADIAAVRQQESHKIAIFGGVMLLFFGYRCGVMKRVFAILQVIGSI